MQSSLPLCEGCIFHKPTLAVAEATLKYVPTLWCHPVYFLFVFTQEDKHLGRDFRRPFYSLCHLSWRESVKAAAAAVAAVVAEAAAAALWFILQCQFPGKAGSS